MGTVDPDAKADVNESTGDVTVDSWLLAEECLIAFEEARYDVRIAEGWRCRELPVGGASITTT
ncbi:MAG: copper chaperone [Paraburkholderia sp.]|nr:MAG: copper chaperone [Paraburkholderia sp.]